MRYFKFLVLSLVSLFFLTSCDWLTDEPVADKEYLEFSALGGEEIVNISKYNGEDYGSYADWTPGYSIDPRQFGPSARFFKVDTLSDGRVKCSEDWVDFIVTPDKKNIRVVVSENKTGKVRKSSFYGHCKALGFLIKVKQSAE